VSEDRGYVLRPIGVVRSSLAEREAAPSQGDEGAPAADVEIAADLAGALDGIEVGAEVVLVTWLHRSRRDVLRVHPRWDASRPLTGVFATRSPDRPNPLGLHRVTVLRRSGTVLTVAPLEAIDGTPVVDIKPVLHAHDR
jgi:tRNA-Thr(GGU) m(6)t(6)A37 methyltransferase TsaA